jgi:hypothetical protein
MRVAGATLRKRERRDENEKSESQCNVWYMKLYAGHYRAGWPQSNGIYFIDFK